MVGNIRYTKHWDLEKREDKLRSKLKIIAREITTHEKVVCLERQTHERKPVEYIVYQANVCSVSA